MSDRTTDKLWKALDEATRDANIDLDTVPWQSRPGFQSAKYEAAAALPKVRAEYAERIFSNTIYFFPVGATEKAAQFAKVANVEGGTFSADAKQVYVDLALRVERTLGQRREFGAQQLTTLNDAIDDVVRSTHSTRSMSVPTSALQSLDALPTFEAVVDHCRTLVEAAHGKDLLRLYLNSHIVDQAVAAKFNAKTLAVVVLNADESTRNELAGSSRSTVVDVDAAAEIDKAFSITIFKEASTKAKRDR
jgi:hypothetical protein